MKRALIGVFLGLLAVPVAWAGVGNPCSAGTPSKYCSLPSLNFTLPAGKPYFAVNRQGWPSVLVGMRMLNFRATFTGSHFGTTGSAGAVSFILPEQAGRQWGGEGTGGATGIGAGFFSNGAPDGWDRRPPVDGWWFRFPVTWSPNSIGFDTDDPATPLAETPEPLTLALFGTGLLLIALITRHRLREAGGSR